MSFIPFFTEQVNSISLSWKCRPILEASYEAQMIFIYLLNIDLKPYKKLVFRPNHFVLRYINVTKKKCVWTFVANVPSTSFNTVTVPPVYFSLWINILSSSINKGHYLKYVMEDN